jgi:hypothetical protein
MEKRGILAQNPLPALGKWVKWADPDTFRLRRPARKAAPTQMISVIIPAHNEARYLGQTLESLARQNYGWFEVIVVANGCTDATADVARGRCQRLIVLSQKSLGIARNLGARMAKGDLLVFLDADTTLEPLTLRCVAEAFTHENGAGTIQGRPDSERLRYRLFYWIKNTVHLLRLHPGSSGVMICWKEHFLRVGGFDEALEVRENSHLMHRLQQFGSYKYLGDVVATTSMRRFEQQGFRETTWLWTKVWLQSLFGDVRHRHYEPIR